MSEYNTAGVHQMNKWVWTRLKAEFPEEFAAYIGPGAPGEGLTPIIPSQQIPTFNNIAGGAPFLVYTYTQTGVGNAIWGFSEQVVYVIYDNNEARLRRIHNFLVHLLRRMDFTAGEINDHPTIDDDFDFKSVTLLTATGPEPFEEEGGRQAASISVRISYTHEIDDKLMRA